MRLLLTCGWGVMTVALAAQTGGMPSFEVVSVKRNVSGEPGSSSIVQPGGRYTATNMTLRMLLVTAYGGPNLRRSNPDACGKPARLFPRAADTQGSAFDGPCGSGQARPGHLAARAMDVSLLTGRLGAWTDRMLVDRTGLSGTFDWDLQWSPEALTPDATSSATAVPLVTALREQLGLRLEARREPGEVLVIDRASRPLPD